MAKASQNTVTLANGKTVEISDMIANPEKYGWVWEWSHLKHNGAVVTMGRGAPRKKHIDRALCEATFGEDFFLKQSNGTSARVVDQTLRDELADNLPLRQDENAMCEWIIRNALGVKARKSSITVVEKIRYADMTGELHDTAEMAKAATLAHMVDSGIDPAVARTMLGI